MVSELQVPFTIKLSRILCKKSTWKIEIIRRVPGALEWQVFHKWLREPLHLGLLNIQSQNNCMRWHYAYTRSTYCEVKAFMLLLACLLWDEILGFYASILIICLFSLSNDFITGYWRDNEHCFEWTAGTGEAEYGKARPGCGSGYLRTSQKLSHPSHLHRVSQPFAQRCPQELRASDSAKH